MSASIADITFTPRASADGTWYVEAVSPSIAGEDVGDFRSKASAEAWIRDVQRSQTTDGAIDSGTHAANAKDADEVDACAPQQA
jgi:hypothetical protein